MDVEGEVDREAEVEVVVVGSGVEGEGAVGEGSRDRVQTKREGSDVGSNNHRGTAREHGIPQKQPRISPDRDGRHGKCTRLRNLVFTW